MPITLNIDTATESAHVSLSKNGVMLHSMANDIQKDHAAFLQPAILELLKATGVLLKDINAVAVTAGPGSYTGLRVGLASAKGICFALNKPLILINTLEVLAFSFIDDLNKEVIPVTNLLCPMLDARRMEVYTALYNTELECILNPVAMILDQDSFDEQLKEHNIVFFGNGSNKWKSICKSNAAGFRDTSITPAALCRLALKKLEAGNFADMAMSQPYYLKDFHDSSKKHF